MMICLECSCMFFVYVVLCIHMHAYIQRNCALCTLVCWSIEYTQHYGESININTQQQIIKWLVIITVLLHIVNIVVSSVVVVVVVKIIIFNFVCKQMSV